MLTLPADAGGSETRGLCCEQGTKGPPCLWSVIPELAHKWGVPQHPPRDLVSAAAASASTVYRLPGHQHQPGVACLRLSSRLVHSSWHAGKHGVLALPFPFAPTASAVNEQMV